MNVSLTPRLEAMIREKVASGRYNNSSEVVREALRLLEEQDKLHRLRAAVAIGEADLARGHVVEWTPTLLDEIWREANDAFEAGELPDPDVCP
ncbi:MAG: type II toxin-antitoxin system ParD family antitoxin [Chloroflexia bacterium]|nr:type II toxin-antitoxin system ParD family antitoxin [Chloroflexia bacterium]MDQ3412273.1 type II toxin-antitoxin system ParD family antitoxin [Chloroflexota bacterium]